MVEPCTLPNRVYNSGLATQQQTDGCFEWLTNGVFQSAIMTEVQPYSNR